MYFLTHRVDALLIAASFFSSSLQPTICAEVTESLSVGNFTVEKAIRSQLPIELNDVLAAIRATTAYAAKGGEIETCLTDCVKSYCDQVDLTAQKIQGGEIPALAEQAQVKLEQDLDSCLIELCGRAGAEKVKFLTIRFFFFQTGSLGRHPIRIDLEKGATQVTVGVDPDPYHVTTLANWLPSKFAHEPSQANKKSSK